MCNTINGLHIEHTTRKGLSVTLNTLRGFRVLLENQMGFFFFFCVFFPKIKTEIQPPPPTPNLSPKSLGSAIDPNP